MDPNTIFDLGTEQTVMTSVVPFLLAPQGRNRVETRPYYYYSLPYFRPLIPTTLFIGLHVSFYLKIALDFGRGRELLMRLF